MAKERAKKTSGAGTITYQEFNAKLEELGLSKKEFAEQTACSYKTVSNWSFNPIPGWVTSWLKYYEISQRYFAIEKALNR
jgi:phenylalanine-4-hydroxylase